nr:hypothetical protein [Actinomycetales bacterium]
MSAAAPRSTEAETSAASEPTTEAVEPTAEAAPEWEQRTYSGTYTVTTGYANSGSTVESGEDSLWMGCLADQCSLLNWDIPASIISEEFVVPMPSGTADISHPLRGDPCAGGAEALSAYTLQVQMTDTSIVVNMDSEGWEVECSGEYTHSSATFQTVVFEGMRVP